MKRTYAIYYSSNSKLMDKVDEERVYNEIMSFEGVVNASVSNEGQIVTIEADTDDFTHIMNKVVNIFRKHDAKSNVKYEFRLNED